MSARTIVGRGSLVVVVLMGLMGLAGCLPVPLGDPARSKADSRFFGVWEWRDGRVHRAVIRPWDERTFVVDVLTGDTALARCVACSAREFAEGHWGRAPRLSRAAELSSGFIDLIDATAVDELVSQRGLRTPFLRMAKDGAVRPAASFTRGGGAGAAIADQAADDKVLAALADGSTLVLQGLHRTWPPLVDFSARLADELGHPVQVNAYVTPPQSPGLRQRLMTK